MSLMVLEVAFPDTDTPLSGGDWMTMAIPNLMSLLGGREALTPWGGTNG